MANTIKSNNDFLKSNTSNILNTISAIDTATLSCHETYDSTTNCPSSEPPIVDTFLTACNELFEKIKSETNLIINIGDGIAELDNIMEGEATTLDIKLSSNLAKEVTPKEFENVAIPSSEEINSQINSAADNANIDLSNLELPHDAFDYGTINNGNNNYQYYYPGEGEELPEEYSGYIESPYGYDDFNSQEIPRMVDGVYRTYTPETNKNNQSDNQESSTINNNPEEFAFNQEPIHPYSLSNKTNPKTNSKINTISNNQTNNYSSNNSQSSEKNSKLDIKDNPIISNLSQTIANTNIKEAEEIKEPDTKTASIISSLAGIGLSSGAVYGVKKYDKNRNKKSNVVKEYTIESYEKEKKEHGYNI